MGGSQHESVANQRAAAEPFDLCPLPLVAVSEPRHMRKLLGIGRLTAHNQGRVAETIVNRLVHDGRIGEEKTVTNLLLEDGLLVAGAGCRWERLWDECGLCRFVI